MAYVVTGAHDLGADDYSTAYVTGWSGGQPEAVTQSASRILDTARLIIDAIAERVAGPQEGLMSQDLTITDLFCGAGGSSIGATAAGASLRMAANHWSLAVESHAANFPEADHDCADVSQVDPRRYPRTDILLASPECTHHSQARSKKHEPNLFDPTGDPSADRSRATMWDVPRFAEFHGYECVVVENVVEVMKWQPIDAWLMAMDSLGYSHRFLCLNSFVAQPTPQSRDRWYCVFWREGNRAPDLAVTAAAHCGRCGRDVEGVQRFKNPAKPWGKYRSQYVYACPHCNEPATPYAYPAASAIDWALPATRIGDRDRPLAPATLRRVEVGLERVAPAPGWLVDTAYSQADSGKVRDVADPWPTQTGRQTWALATPFVAELRGGGSKDKTRPVTDPLATVTASGNHHGLVIPPAFYIKNYGSAEQAGSMAKPVTDPFGSMTAVDSTSLVTLPPFTVDYHGNGRATPVDRPLPTQDTRDRHALVQPGEQPSVEDCGFRMLEPHEIGRAMAFPDEYVVLGNKRQRVRQYGNAVTPPVMTELVSRCIESLAA